MKNRKILHDYGIILIVLAIIDLLSLVTSTITQIMDGTLDNVFATVESSLLTAVKVSLVAVIVLQAVLILAQIAIGWIGLKVSRNPVANKGYITAAKVFFVLNIIATICVVIVLISSGSNQLFNNILSLLCAVADVLIYYYFIKSAKAVRQSVLENK